MERSKVCVYRVPGKPSVLRSMLVSCHSRVIISFHEDPFAVSSDLRSSRFMSYHFILAHFIQSHLVLCRLSVLHHISSHPSPSHAFSAILNSSQFFSSHHCSSDIFKHFLAHPSVSILGSSFSTGKHVIALLRLASTPFVSFQVCF